MIVTDYRGRKLTLLARVARKTLGHRYVTRKSVAAVIRGEATHTRPAWNCGTQARKGWPSRDFNGRIRIGCHVFIGEDAQRLRAWALTL